MSFHTHRRAYCQAAISGINDTITRSQEEGKEILYSVFDTTLVVGIMPFLVIVGLVTNLSFLFVVVRLPHMRTVTNYYLCQLALADTALLVTAVGEKIWYYVASPVEIDVRVFGAAGCIWTYFLKKTFGWVSMLLVTLVNLERFNAVCRPLKYRVAKAKCRRETFWRILGAWAVSVLVSLFGVPSNSRYVLVSIVWLQSPPTDPKDHSSDIGICCEINSTLNWVVLAVYGLVFLASFFANLLMSVRIIRALRCRVEVAPVQHLDGVRARRTEINNQISRMLIVNCSVYFLLQIPRHCYNIAQVIKLEALHPHERHTVLNVTRILLYLNSVINPVIYVAVNSRYREAFKRVFWKRSSTLTT